MHVQSARFKLGYPFDGRSVETDRIRIFAVGEELGVEDTALRVADADRVVVVDSRKLYQEIRIRRSSSDGAASASASAAGATKVNPLYGDVGAEGAQQVIRAVGAVQLDYRGSASWPDRHNLAFPAGH